MGHRTVFRRPTVIAGVAVALVMAVIGIFAPVLASHDPNAAGLGTYLTPPGGFADGGAVHILGTDHLGRDVLSRTVTSFRTNLYIGLLGTLLGTVAAWLLVIVRGIRGAAPTSGSSAPLFGLPFYGLAILTYIVGVILSLSVTASLGPTVVNVIVCVGMFSAILPMALASESARRDGASSSPIRFDVLGGIALFPVTFSLALLMGLFIEFSLAFLGVGVPPSIPSLGGMVAAVTRYAVYWWTWVFPLGIVLVGLVAFSAILFPVGRGLSPPARAILPARGGDPAGFWIRLAAYLIDMAAIIFLILLSYFLFAMVGLASALAGVILIFVVLVALVWVPAVSPGKQALGLLVLRGDGSRAGLGRKLFRAVAQMLSELVFCIGFLMIAFRKDKRGLHDLICDTVVVHRQRPEAVRSPCRPPDARTR